MNYPAEIVELQNAHTFSPNNTAILKILADAYLKHNFITEAENSYKALIALDKNHLDAKYGLIQCYLLNGKRGAALMVYEEIFNSTLISSRHMIAYSKLLLEEKEFDKALKVYKHSLKLFPFDTDKELDNAFRMGEKLSFDTNEDDEDDDFGDFLPPGLQGDFSNENVFFEKPNINFKDVGGMDEVKKEIGLKIIMPLKHPELYKAYGKKTGGGILMYGPPGCGKTFLAKATAGEADANFLNVGIADVLDMWIGNSEKQLHNLFVVARENNPSVMFFDEVDALGASRSDMKSSNSRHLINQFLNELDGVDSDNEGLLILAATNAPWHLDPAFRRPGRFDKILFIPPPDDAAKTEILKIILANKPTEKIDFEAIAKKAKDFSGADLKALVDVVIEQKLTESFTTGKPAPITQKDLEKGLLKIVPSTKEWFATAKNYAMFANQSGLYDDILKYLKIEKW